MARQILAAHSWLRHHPALTSVRQVQRWEDPMLGGILQEFDAIRWTEAEYQEEVRFNQVVRVGIGAEGPAEIEEFKDPDEISAGDWKPPRKTPPRPRKSLEEAVKLMGPKLPRATPMPQVKRELLKAFIEGQAVPWLVERGKIEVEP